LAQHDLSIEDYDNVVNWKTYPGYDDGERAALEYAEKFCLDHLSIDQGLIDRLLEAYGAEAVAER
jgi:alkylhydroperoxidase family enzyme